MTRQLPSAWRWATMVTSQGMPIIGCCKCRTNLAVHATVEVIDEPGPSELVRSGLDVVDSAFDLVRAYHEHITSCPGVPFDEIVDSSLFASSVSMESRTRIVDTLRTVVTNMWLSGVKREDIDRLVSRIIEDVISKGKTT